MKFLEENNGAFLFQLEDGSTHLVGANSKKEALNILENRTEPNEVDVLKDRLLSKVKTGVSKRLQATDYKVIRHRDEQKLIDMGEVITTTLTSNEYKTLLNERKALRDWSNDKEVEINNASTLKELEQISVEY